MTVFGKVALVMRGTIVAQLAGLLALPIMSRLFPVAAFGQFQLYQSIMGICLVFSALRFEVAVLNARTDAELRSVIHLSVLINLVTASVAGLLIWIAAIAGWPVGMKDWVFGGLTIALVTLLAGIAQTLTYVVTRNEDYAAGSNIRIVTALGFGGTGLGLAFWRPMLSGVILADIASKAINAVLLVRNAARNGVYLWPVEPLSRLADTARRYRNYPFMSLPGGLCNALTIAIAPFMIFATFGEEVTGQFGLIERGLTLPLNLVILAVTQVFTAELAKSIRQSDVGIHARFRGLLVRLAMLGVVPTIMLIVVGPTIVQLVFGDRWGLAGTFCQVLAPFYLASFLSGVAGMALLVLERQKQQLIWEFCRLIVLIVTWVMIRQMGADPVSAIALNFGVHIVFGVIYLAMADHYLRRHEQGVAAEGNSA